MNDDLISRSALLKGTTLIVDGVECVPVSAITEAPSIDVAFCLECGQKQEYSVMIEPCTVEVRGTSFSYLEKKARCAVCGSEVYVPEINDENVVAREKAFHDAREEECKMYTMYHEETPVAYRYGPKWKAMQLYMEGGYPTPEEAIAAWEREKNG